MEFVINLYMEKRGERREETRVGGLNEISFEVSKQSLFLSFVTKEIGEM